MQRNNYLITDKYIPEFRTLKKIAKKRKLKIKTINLKKSYDDLSKFKLIGDFQKKNLLMAIYASQIIGLKEKLRTNKNIQDNIIPRTLVLFDKFNSAPRTLLLLLFIIWNFCSPLPANNANIHQFQYNMAIIE